MKQKDELKRQAIINETIAIVYANGFAGIKMAQIAKMVDISPSTLYVYFKNKEHLIVSIATDLLQIITDYSQREISQDLPYKLKFKALWLSYINFWVNHKKEVSFINQVKQSPYYEKIPKHIRDLKASLAIDLLEEGKAIGEIKTLGNEVLSAVVVGVMNETVKLIDSRVLQLNSTDTDVMFSMVWDAVKV